MAYNKTKHVEAAQKYLHQGKIAQAVSEYQQILKHEPKDQVTLMTVGDLYVRQGETFQALEYFERLAQIFLAEGFLTKAIAIYKKIAKLAPEETRPVERLAELYVQQGVLSEARPLYLRLAELHERAGRQQQAAALLRKLLEAEPDNLRVQTRLAELFLALGQPAEAASAFLAAGRHLQARGDHAEATKFADRALEIAPHNPQAVAAKARSLFAAGQRAEASALIESMPDVDNGGEATDLLLDFYLDAGEAQHAGDLAGRIFARDSRHFSSAHRVATALLESNEAERALALLDLVREAMMEAGEQEPLSHSLERASERLPSRLEPFEWLVDLYGRTSNSFRLPEALAKLAEACEAVERQERALQVYEQLLDLDPENETARSKYNLLRERMGLGAAPRQERPAESAEPAQAPRVAEPPLDPETQRFVTQALTDVDLFSSYGLTQKATDLLESVVQRAPRHTPALERLLDLAIGAGKTGRATDLAALLEQIHAERGNSAAAERFAEMRRRFERSGEAASADAEAPASEAAPPPPAPATVPEPIAEAEPAASEEVAASGEDAAAEPAVHEVDLSEEWAALVSDSAGQTAFSTDAPEAAAPESGGTAEETPAGAPGDYVLELDSDSGQTRAREDDFLQSLSAELADAMPSLAPPGPPDGSAAANAAGRSEGEPPQTPPEEAPGLLHEVFEEFRNELGESTPEDEDLETHYNLGIAYREMGLIEEAISEFQKVAKANKGQAFRYAMQCCTLLGLAFMEKGQPSIAAMWYERALETPGLDQESILALRYDLGVAQELAGDMTAARKSFSQVYGMNIDYRDVAERLAALGRGH
jgi:tetratricopeptide (TPR) repeat protein